MPKGIISQGAPPHVRESIDLCIRQKFPGTSSRASYSDKIGISQQCFWTDDGQVSGEREPFPNWRKGARWNGSGLEGGLPVRRWADVFTFLISLDELLGLMLCLFSLWWVFGDPNTFAMETRHVSGLRFWGTALSSIFLPKLSCPRSYHKQDLTPQDRGCWSPNKVHRELCGRPVSASAQLTGHEECAEEAAGNPCSWSHLLLPQGGVGSLWLKAPVFLCSVWSSWRKTAAHETVRPSTPQTSVFCEK